MMRTYLKSFSGENEKKYAREKDFIDGMASMSMKCNDKMKVEFLLNVKCVDVSFFCFERECDFCFHS